MKAPSVVLVCHIVLVLLTGLASGQGGGPPVVFTVSNLSEELRSVDPATGAQLWAVTMVNQAVGPCGAAFPAGCLSSAYALAIDPMTDELYVIAGVVGCGRGLIKVNPGTGCVTIVGCPGSSMTGIAFDSTGTLYGISSVQSSTVNQFVQIDKTTGVSTFIAWLTTGLPSGGAGSGQGGQGLAFNPDDGIMYHTRGASWGGTQVFETIDLVTGATTPIPLSGAGYGKAASLGYKGNGDFYMATTDFGGTNHWATIDTTGFVTQLSSGAPNYKGIAATTASYGQPVPVSGFECQVPGTSVPGLVPDCEGWQSVDGVQLIRAGGLVQGCQLPGSGQFCEVSPNGLGPASPLAPPCVGPPGSCPGIQPPTIGTASEMRFATTVPTPAAGGQIVFRVDWYWFSGESPGSDIYNDYAQVTLIDSSTGLVAATAFRVDTHSNLSPALNFYSSGVSGFQYPNAFGPPRTATITVPASLHGNAVDISVVAANQGDNAFDSVLWVDNLTWEIIAPSGPPASVTTLGASCGPVTLTSTLPIQGGTTIIDITSATGSIGFLLLGAQGTPLQVVPGCFLQLDPLAPLTQIPVLFFAGALSIPAPIAPGSAGAQFTLQAVDITPVAMAGYFLSNGLTLTVGN